jgi:hypothetical protein
VRHLVRSSRSRRAFVWCCVPYLLLALFADFLHAHPLLTSDVASVGIFHQVPSAAAERAHRLPERSCAICQAQRIRPTLQDKTVATHDRRAAATMVVAIPAAAPKSPVPHPSAFRGPPSAFFS